LYIGSLLKTASVKASQAKISVAHAKVVCANEVLDGGLEDIVTENIIRKSLCGGVNFTAIHDERFKQNQLSVSFLLPLSRETASVNALLPLVLRHDCREFPDMTLLNVRLKELYGAHIDGSTSKRGEVQIVTLYCDSLGDSYAFGGEHVLEQCAALLRSVIFDPALEGGAFKAGSIEIEKKNLVDMIDSQLNDKRHYATKRLKEEMCKNEAYGIGELGCREDVAAITPETLYEAWLAMLSKARAEIFVLGPGDTRNVEKLFADSFASLNRETANEITTQVIKTVENVKTVEEHLPVTQAKLVMGLRAGIAAPENTDAMQLACAILGGTPQSKLFVNVREKMSLCYYCLSYFERQKGLVIIDSGIEGQNYEKAKTEILRQLDELKMGNFTDDELRFAKLSLQNSFTQVNDSLDEMNIYYLGQAISGSVRTPAQAADSIMKVLRKDVINAASGIQLDTVYLLAGNTGDKEGV
jgi:predicted Zn-dependent peptidase